MTFGWLAGSRHVGGESSAHGSVAQWAFLWAIWPTWILLLDAEHTGTIIFMLLLASPLNGLWYATAASLLWYTGAFLKRLTNRTSAISAKSR
jgi:hypothetical protein